jgi:hypothetical protein
MRLRNVEDIAINLKIERKKRENVKVNGADEYL